MTNEVANDQSRMPLGSGFVRSRESESSLMGEGHVIDHAAGRERVVTAADALWARVNGYAPEVILRMSHVQDSVNIAMDVNGGLVLLEFANAGREVAKVLLHGCDVNA